MRKKKLQKTRNTSTRRENESIIIPVDSMQSDPAEIRDYIYLGSARAASDEVSLRELGISHIINAAVELPNELEPHFTYLRLDLDDDQKVNIIDAIDDCYNFIERCRNDGGKVLVHCQAGISRSATIVIAHLMKKEDMSLRDAFFDVKSRRSQIGPNIGFFRQLTEFEVSLGREVTFEVNDYIRVRLISMGFDEEAAMSAASQCREQFGIAVGLALAYKRKK